jgi:ankyrin repeat protein
MDEEEGRRLWHAAQKGQIPSPWPVTTLPWKLKALSVAAWNDEGAFVAELARTIRAPLSEYGDRPLVLAATHGSNSAASALLEANTCVDVSFLCTRGKGTPLMCAASNGHVSTVQLLLDANAPVHRMWSHFSHPLCTAAESGHVPVVQLLLNTGAQVNETDRDGRTPLNRACTYGHAPVVALLLQAKANVDICDTVSASVEGHAAVVALLLQRNEQGGRV